MEPISESRGKNLQDLQCLFSVLHERDASRNVTLLLDEILQRDIDRFEAYLNKNVDKSWVKSSLSLPLKGSEFVTSKEGSRFQYIQLSIQMILILTEILNDLLVLDDSTKSEEVSPRDLLSVQFKNLIFTTLQFVVSLGIIPNLLPGVGISLEKRTVAHKGLHDVTCSANTDVEKQCLLHCFLTNLMEAMKNKQILDCMVTRYSVDILAAQCQLGYLPLNDDDNFPKELHNSWKQMLESYVTKVPNLVVRDLFVLQGSSLHTKRGKTTLAVPAWLQKAVMRLITKVILHPSGVLSVICGMLDMNGSSGSDSAHWKKHDIVSKLIGTCPPCLKSEEYYYSKVCPQVLQLLQNDHMKKISSIVIGIINTIGSKHPKYLDQFLLSSLVSPLRLCTTYAAQTTTDTDVMVTADDLGKCIETLHMLIYENSSPSNIVNEQLVNLWDVLFHIYSFALSSVSYLRVSLHDLLRHILDKVGEIKGAELFKMLIFDDFEVKDILHWNSSLEVTPGSGGSLSVRKKSDSRPSEFDWLQEDEKLVDSIIVILESLKEEKIVSNIFLNLLKHLPLALISENCKKAECADPQFALLDIESQSEKRLKSIRQCLMLCTLLKRFSESEKLIDVFIHNGSASLHLIKVTLIRASELCSTPENLSFGIDTLRMAMTFLSIFMTQQLSKTLLNELKQMVPSLNTLETCHSDEEIREIAKQLKIAILTHGVMPSFTSSSSAMHLSVAGSSDAKSGEESNSSNTCTLQQAMLDLRSPHLPIRGHALLSMRRLLEKRDLETLKAKEEIFDIFKSNLLDEDSYIYLNAIQGLATLADTHHNFVVPLLAKEFASRVELSPELRMKIGEVLVRVTRDLGDITPTYRNIFLNTFLTGCKDPDPFIRASSLTNLGEVCKNLRFGIGAHVHEILSCAGNLLQSDSAVEVRRAGALFLTLLLRGLGKATFQVLDQSLKNLYRLLKLTLAVEKDEVVQVHIQLCLEELDVVTREYLFPQQSLTKKIGILDLSC